MDNYYLRLGILSALLIKLGVVLVMSMEYQAIHPALVSLATAIITCLSILVLVRMERHWRYLKPEELPIVSKFQRVAGKFIPKLARKPLITFKVRDSSISFLTPMPLLAIKSLHNTAKNAKLIRHEYYQTGSNLNMTISCEYALYNQDSQPNVERMIEKRVQEYTEIDPAAASKYLLSMNFEHLGVETYLLNGTFINNKEIFEYRAMYFHGGHRFWCIHTLFPSRNRNGSTASIKLLGSVQFNFELPYFTINDTSTLDWTAYQLDNETLTFRTPGELYRNQARQDAENRFMIINQEHFSSMSNCNLVVECGFKQYHHNKKLGLDDAVAESLEFFADEYNVPAYDIRLIRLTEFPVEGRWLQGSLEHNFHTWAFHQAVFTLGNRFWYIRLRYYQELEGGYEVFESILDSIRFDRNRLDEVINQMLDNFKTRPS